MDAAAVNEAVATARRGRDENDMRALLSSPAGRRFLGVLLYEVCGLKRLSLVDSAAMTAANEGGRNVGLQLLARIEAIDFQAALAIQSERENERRADELQAKQAIERDSASRPPPLTSANQPLDDVAR